MDGRYRLIPLLTSTVPELISNIVVGDVFILEGEIIANGGGYLFWIFLVGEHSDEACLPYSTAPYKADLNELIYIGLIFESHLH